MGVGAAQVGSRLRVGTPVDGGSGLPLSPIIRLFMLTWRLPPVVVFAACNNSSASHDEPPPVECTPAKCALVLWAHEQRLYPDYTPRRPATGEPRPGNTPTSMPVPPMRPALTISGLARVRSFGRRCRWATASGADRHACATSPRPPCPNTRRTAVAWVCSDCTVCTPMPAHLPTRSHGATERHCFVPRVCAGVR